jgi:isoaspartyl peptidase/L-asparaginase-like protein (Ntn-hydrolase superfamily)
LSVKEAGKELMQTVFKNTKGDVGFIALDTEGRISLEFNSERMHRGYKTGDELFTAIY